MTDGLPREAEFAAELERVAAGLVRQLVDSVGAAFRQQYQLGRDDGYADGFDDGFEKGRKWRWG